MGCGSVCVESANPTSIIFNSFRLCIRFYLTRLNKSSILVTKQARQIFVTNYLRNQRFYYLKIQQKLQQNSLICQQILQKWKFILFAYEDACSSYSQLLGLPQQKLQQQDNIQQKLSLSQTFTQQLIFHSSFSQIDKDIDRTIKIPQGRKPQFINILKRITNFFPIMGYTQGMNFIVAYLIYLGYSQSDSFWMFIHLAIDRRFMLLGLYEEGFPLSEALTIIFKNILKRINVKLYNHIFEQLQIDSHQWIFKWFMTCFVSYFPLSMVEHVWDMMLNLGNIGLVIFGLGITEQLSSSLLLIQQDSDINQVLQPLKQIKYFNKAINLQNLLLKSYSIQIVQSDFQGIQNNYGIYGTQLKANRLYNNYHLPKGNQPISAIYHQQQVTSLSLWYQQMIHQKQQFILHQNEFKTNQISQLKQNYPQVKINYEKQIIKEDLVKNDNNQAINIKEDKNNQVANTKDDKNSQKASTKQTFSNKRRNSLDLPKKQQQNLVNRLPYQIQNIVQGPQQQNSSSKSRSHYSEQSKNTKMVVPQIQQLQIIKKQFEARKNVVTVKNNNFTLSPILNSGVKTKTNSSKIRNRLTQTNQFQIPSLKTSKIFAQAARNSLKMDNCDVVSISSKNQSNKQKNIQNRQKGEMSPKYKMRTQQNRQIVEISQNNSRRQSSQKQLSLHIKQIGQTKSIDNLDGQQVHNKNVSYSNFMINSMGPNTSRKINYLNHNQNSQVQSQFEGYNRFKKYQKATNGQIIKKQIQSQIVAANEHQIQSVEQLGVVKLSIQQSRVESVEGRRMDVESIR